MSYIQIIKNKQGQTLYKGQYPTFASCVESALAQGICLRYGDFRNKPMANVSLDNADLSYADFTDANLTGANLSEITAHYATFNNTDLYNTCFAYADIQHSTFFFAGFGGTDFSGSNISYCRFSGTACFDIDFRLTHHMNGCTYIHPKTQKAELFSTPPLIIKGFDSPMIITDSATRIRIHKTIRGYAAHLHKNTPKKGKIILT